MTNQEKLQTLMLMKNPNATSQLATTAQMQFAVAQMIQELWEKANKVKGDKGEKGDSPIKGVDYFTQDEINSFIVYIQSQIKDGKDGKDARDGKDGRNGIDAVMPDINKIAELAAKKVKIPKVEKLVIPTIEEIIFEIEKKPKKKVSIRDIHDINELIEFLKLGGYRGGGSSTSTGGGFTLLNTSILPNGVIQAFTFLTATAQPTLVCIDGAFTPAVDNLGVTQWTWNNGTKTVTLTINAPTSNIFAIQ